MSLVYNVAEFGNAKYSKGISSIDVKHLESSFLLKLLNVLLGGDRVLHIPDCKNSRT